MKLPNWARLVLFLAAFYTLVPLAATYTGWPVSLMHRDATVDNPVAGYLTSIVYNRGQRSYHLNDNNLVYYDFYDYQPARAPLAHLVLTPAQHKLLDSLGLGPFLREGDYLHKAAHDSVLAVRRGEVTTYWLYAPPHAKRHP